MRFLIITTLLFFSLFSFSSFAVDMPPKTVLIAYGNLPTMLTMLAYQLDPVTNTATPLFAPQQVNFFYDSLASIEMPDGRPVVLAIHQNTLPGYDNIDIFYPNANGPPTVRTVPGRRGVAIKAIDAQTALVVGYNNAIFSLNISFNSATNGTAVPITNYIAPPGWLDPKYGQIRQISPVSTNEFFAVTDNGSVLCINNQTILWESHYPQFTVESIIADRSHVWIVLKDMHGRMAMHSDSFGHGPHTITIPPPSNHISPQLLDIDPVTGNLFFIQDDRLYEHATPIRGSIQQTVMLLSDLQKRYRLNLPTNLLHFALPRAVTANGRPTIFWQSSVGTTAPSPAPAGNSSKSLFTKADFIREFQSLSNPTINQMIAFLNARPDLLVVCMHALPSKLKDIGLYYFSGQIKLHDSTTKKEQDPVDVPALADVLSQAATETGCQEALAKLKSSPTP